MSVLNDATGLSLGGEACGWLFDRIRQQLGEIRRAVMALMEQTGRYQ